MKVQWDCLPLTHRYSHEVKVAAHTYSHQHKVYSLSVWINYSGISRSINLIITILSTFNTARNTSDTSAIKTVTLSQALEEQIVSIYSLQVCVCLLQIYNNKMYTATVCVTFPWTLAINFHTPSWLCEMHMFIFDVNPLVKAKMSFGSETHYITVVVKTSWKRSSTTTQNISAVISWLGYIWLHKKTPVGLCVWVRDCVCVCVYQSLQIQAYISQG